MKGLFQGLAEYMPDAIVVVDDHGLIVLVNSQAERMFGYARDELLGRPVESLLPERFRQAHAGHRGKYSSQPRTRPMGAGLDLFGRRQDGSEFPVEISLSPLQTESGTMAMSAIRDVTDRKRAEQALRLANEELESFAYSVSHDLRAPLRTIDGFSQAVLEDYGPQLPPEGQQQLRWIREGAQRMGQLIDELLNFSRLSRLEMHRENIDMRALAQRAWEEVGEQSRSAVDIRIGELPPCQGDAALLKQVWLNLLSNAVKYSRQRETPRIEVGGNVGPVYWVRDNGVGFDMQYAQKLFGVFQRMHLVEEYEGSGVGLAIVRRIVERHHGQVWAEAVADGGATFSFALPEVNP